MKYSISRSQRKVICRAVSFRSLLGLFPLAAFSSLVPLTVQAQVTPDGTTSTTVNQNGNNFTIEQGDRSGDNLFHSFDEFSVPTLGSAVFNNATDIANIFSRVTGSSISSIDGLLGTNGTANLYLINPNGIIFGENARLNLGGSFFASTTDSLLFEGDTEFSASNPQASPLLEVSIPTGARFRDNPGDILVNTDVNSISNTFLSVNPSENITFIGGNLNLNQGFLLAPDGKIELGSLINAGEVSITDDSLNFPENVTRGNITLDSYFVDVTNTGLGEILLHGQNVSLTSSSFIGNGIAPNLFDNNDIREKGDINITATGAVTVNQASSIQNQIFNNASGNTGNINIETNSLNLTEGSRISTSIFGNGDGGSVIINAKDNIIFDGFGNEGIPSGILSNVGSESSIGNAGDIQINTSDLTLTNGGVINSTTFGQGNAGKVSIDALNTLSINGEAEDPFFKSSITSGVANTGVGNSGGIDLSTSNLSLINGGLINGRTDGVGNGGNINLQVESLSLENNSRINASTFNRGDAGKIIINAANDISLDTFSGIGSEIVGNARGNSAGIDITTANLSLNRRSLISANNLGEGNAGNITINTTGNIILNQMSGISSLVENNAVGNAGDVEIITNNLSLAEGSLIDTSSLGEGNSGNITINAGGEISIDGINSVIFSEIDDNANGNSQGIDIVATNLSLSNEGSINSNSTGNGNSGKISLNIADSITIDSGSNIFNAIAENSSGRSEGIEITTTNLSITNGGRINSSTFGLGDAGLITIDVTESIFVDGNNSGILSGVSNTAQANSEGIEINTGNLSLTNGGTIDSQVAGIGNAGNITINATGNILIDGITENEIVSSVFSVISPGAEGNAGNIQINASNLTLSNSGQIDGSTFGKGDSGEINVNTTGDISIDGDRSGIFTTVGEDGLGNAGEGNAGDVEISTVNLSFTNGGQVSSNTSGIGNGGNINISASKSIFVNGLISGIQTSVIEGSQGNAGDIVVDTQNLVLINNGTINASTFGEGNAGKIDINVFESFIAAGNGLTGVISLVGVDAQGNAEGIEINSPNIFLLDGGTINTRSFGLGNAGDITVNVDTINIKDNSQIEASNTPSEDLTTNLSGGNINLSILDSLILSDNGDITATASQNANGGNVNINADDGFIIAFPGGDNDITANASQGNGGNININTQAIFGLEERPSTPPNQTNDIDASSEFGLQGDFSLNTPDFDPTTGLIELPAAVGDASDQISQNPCQQGVGSQFIVTGKGGLPPAPTETLNGGGVEVDLVEPLPQPLSYEEKGARLREGEVVQTSKPNSENQISKSVPAMGWVFNDKGEVTLTAYSNKDPESVRSPQDRTTCNANISP